MSVDPVLLIRRWPERRPVVLASAVAGFAAIAIVGDRDLELLYVVPVLLVALELGLAGGLVAAAAAIVLAPGAVVPAAVAIAVGVIGGRFSSRMHAAHGREQRLLDSAIGLADLATHDRLPRAVAAAALRTPGATGAEVTLDGRRAAAGTERGWRTAVAVAVRGEQLGSIELFHRRRLAPDDRAALELLAVQAGLAADNQRLLVQRAGLGRLLDAEEDGRRRHAETLHEELAQVLAGVLMQLRAGDDGSLEDEVRGVLAELREVATEMRPSTLAQLGLVPALEAIDGLVVQADPVLEVPEPLRTGVYRLVEHVASAAPGAGVRLQGRGDELDVTIDAALTGPEPVAAARARVALLGGTLAADSRPDGRTRMSVRLPMRHPLHA